MLHWFNTQSQDKTSTLRVLLQLDCYNVTCKIKDFRCVQYHTLSTGQAETKGINNCAAWSNALNVLRLCLHPVIASKAPCIAHDGRGRPCDCELPAAELSVDGGNKEWRGSVPGVPKFRRSNSTLTTHGHRSDELSSELNWGDELLPEFSRSDELSQNFVGMTNFHAFPSNSRTFSLLSKVTKWRRLLLLQFLVTTSVSVCQKNAVGTNQIFQPFQGP
jgi:hypothetical protein